MKHIGTRELHTERLTLRKFTVNDAKPMYENWASDPLVTKYLTWPAHASEDVTRSLLTYWEAGYEMQDNYLWAIVPDDEGEPVGSIAVVSIHEETERAEVGYCIGRRWWGRGIAPEALSEVIRFLLTDAGFHRVEALHDVNNPNSGRVMQKCGMKYEGTLRAYSKNNQGICDVCMYSILSEEYKKDAAR